MKVYRYIVAVYRHADEAGTSREWSACIKWWSEGWAGFQGTFEVAARGARDAHKQAIALAKAKAGVAS